jgi:hypothetical protein
MHDSPRLIPGLLLLTLGLAPLGCRSTPDDADPAAETQGVADLTMGTTGEDGPSPPEHGALDGDGPNPQRTGPGGAGEASPTLADTTAPGPPPPGGQYVEGEFKPAQIQEAVRNFADQYRQTIATACDQVILETDDPDLRRRAQQTKLHGATAIYDIAVDPVPASAMINAAVTVSLQRNFLARHGEEFFGPFAPRLLECANFLQEEAFAICARAMTNEQRRELLKLCNDWSAANPDVYDFWYVRLTDLPGINPGTSVATLVGNITDLPMDFLNKFNPFSGATESVSEAQALAERMSWLGPRLMILAQWRVESVMYETLANPQIEDALDLGQRYARVAEQLPQMLTEQRQALFQDLEDNQSNISSLLGDVRGLAGEAENLLTTADQVVARVQQVYQTYLDTQAAKPPEPESAEPARPFDITEYTAALEELDRVVVHANTLLQNADQATQAEALDARLTQVEDTASHLIWTAAAATLGVGLLLILAVKFIPPRSRT